MAICKGDPGECTFNGSLNEPVAVPHGWRLVPVEPTEEMIAAASGGSILDANLSKLFRTGLFKNWADMLSAAPQPEAGTQRWFVPAEICERLLRMLLSEPDAKGALFKAENLLCAALEDANASTPQKGT